jgi:hypothetical protein
VDCGFSGCLNEAKWQLGWRAWAIDRSKSDNPLMCCMNAVVCDEHKARLTIKHLVPSPEIAAKINDDLERCGGAPLDFNRAEPLFHEIVDGVLWSEGAG